MQTSTPISSKLLADTVAQRFENLVNLSRCQSVIAGSLQPVKGKDDFALRLAMAVQERANYCSAALGYSNVYLAGRAEQNSDHPRRLHPDLSDIAQRIDSSLVARAGDGAAGFSHRLTILNAVTAHPALPPDELAAKLNLCMLAPKAISQREAGTLSSRQFARQMPLVPFEAQDASQLATDLNELHASVKEFAASSGMYGNLFCDRASGSELPRQRYGDRILDIKQELLSQVFSPLADLVHPSADTRHFLPDGNYGPGDTGRPVTARGTKRLRDGNDAGAHPSHGEQISAPIGEARPSHQYDERDRTREQTR